MRSFWVPILVAAACVGVGLAAGRTWLAERAGPQRAAPAEPHAETSEAPRPAEDFEDLWGQLRALRKRLEHEAHAREQLAQRLERLEAELSLEVAEAAPEEEEAEAASEPADDERSPGFDETALLPLGMSRAEVTRLHERFDAFEMERLELLDRATREGWVRRPRFWSENQERRWALRDELGDELYDRLLYAEGRRNRVVVRDVLHLSPAAAAGIQEGDEILRYDGERVFNVFELRRATTAGRKGESVEVELRRNGQSVRAYMPRGPLGVQLSADRRSPDGT